MIGYAVRRGDQYFTNDPAFVGSQPYFGEEVPAEKVLVFATQNDAIRAVAESTSFALPFSGNVEIVAVEEEGSFRREVVPLVDAELFVVGYDHRDEYLGPHSQWCGLEKAAAFSTFEDARAFRASADPGTRDFVGASTIVGIREVRPRRVFRTLVPGEVVA